MAGFTVGCAGTELPLAVPYGRALLWPRCAVGYLAFRMSFKEVQVRPGSEVGVFVSGLHTQSPGGKYLNSLKISTYFRNPVFNSCTVLNF